MSYSLISILTQFAYLIPPCVAYVVGIVLAVQRKRSHPFSAGLALWGFLVLLIETLVVAAIRIVLIYDRSGIGFSGNSSLLFSAVGILQMICFTVGLGLLIGAIFAERGPRPMDRRRDVPDDFDAPYPTRPHESPPRGASGETSYRERRDL